MYTTGMHRRLLAIAVGSSGTAAAAAASLGRYAQQEQEPQQEQQQHQRQQRSPANHNGREFDYVVVGAGSSGCALATRLAQRLPHHRTLLLEAGTHNDVPEIQTAVDYFGKVERVFGSNRDWQFHAEASAQLNGRALYWPRGKTIGGCSSFNTMVWMRPDPRDFDAWRAATGFAEWGREAMEACFRRVESHPFASERGAEHHGSDGPITVAPLDHVSHAEDDASSPVTRAFIDASVAMGHRVNEDWGSEAGNHGVGLNHVNAKAGRRCSAAAYLAEVGAYPRAADGADGWTSSSDGALELWLHAAARRVVFDEERRVVGVVVKIDPEAADDGGECDGGDEDKGLRGAEATEVVVRARREVILCAGAVGTPHLLMLSGVGPAEELRRAGVAKVVSDVPGVGKDLQDHLHLPMAYEVPPQRIHPGSNICEGSLYASVGAGVSAPSSAVPDLQVHCGTIFFHPDGFTPREEISGFTLTPSLIRPRSKGSIGLCSADPDEQPAIKLVRTEAGAREKAQSSAF